MSMLPMAQRKFPAKRVLLINCRRSFCRRRRFVVVDVACKTLSGVRFNADAYFVDTAVGDGHLGQVEADGDQACAAAST